MITDWRRGCFELVEGNAGFQKALWMGQRLELLIGRHHRLEAVALALFALGIDEGLGEEARAVEVHVRVEEFAQEVIDPGSEVLRDMGITQVLAHHSRVLGFNQRIVVAVARARLG